MHPGLNFPLIIMQNLMLLLSKGKAISTFLKDKLPFSISIFLGVFLLSFSNVHAMRERTDSKSSGLILSTVTVGTGGNYTTLKAAFDAINSGVVSGVVTIQIISSTTETAMASLNASATGLASYSSVLIYATGSGYSISGNIANPLVSLNGADNVTIDGRVNATGTAADLIFTNTNTGAAAASLRLINSAENNSVRYVTLKASGISASTGIVYFVSSASGNGNDNNIIEYCNLTSAGLNRPLNAILSYGTAGRENSGNIIRSNAIYNFFNDSNSSNGINIAGNSSDWKINSNSFYDTASLVCTGNNVYSVIRISTASMHTVSGNFIGGSGPLCAGAPWTMNSSFATTFSGIFFTGNTSVPSLLENNTIQNFVYSSTSANPWDGIYLSMGNAVIQGNTIGAASGTNSIVITTPNAAASATISGGIVTGLTLVGGGSGFTAPPQITFTLSGSTTAATATAAISGGVVTGFTITNGGSGYTSVPSVNVNGSGYSTSHGIRYLNSGEVSIENNSIGSITTYGNSGYSHCFEGIVISGVASSVITISNNLIGSLSTAGSIQTSSPATASLYKQDLRGIYVNSAVNLVSITGNTIANMTSAYNGTSVTKIDGICTSGASNIIRNNTVRDLTSSSNSTLRGIQQTVVLAGTSQSLTGNTVYNLRNNHASAAVGVIGIDYSGPNSGTNTVSGNFIHDLSLASNNILSEIDGILLGNGVTTADNNIINIGTGVTAGYKIYGINDNSTNNALYNNNIYFNTVYVAGSVSSGTTSSTAALWNVNNTSTRNYRNNILMNIRTGGAAGKHYAIRVAGISGLTIDYNDYVVAGNAFLASFNSTDKTTLALWKAATLQDASSLNINPLFAVPGSNLALNYYTSAALPAVTGTGITADYTGLARSTVPKMGALEITAYVWSGATSTDFATTTNWQGGLVPPNGSDISFAVSPFNNCVLDQNRTVRNITNAQPTYKLLLNGHELTILGNLVFSNNAKIDATAAGSILTFAGTAAQNIPAGALLSNTMDGLNANNPEGLTLNDNITVNNPTTLSSGELIIGAHTLTLNGPISVVSGSLTGGLTSNITIGGSGTASLSSVILNNLTLNRAAGINLSGAVSVAGTLALQSGILSVGSNTMTLSGSSPTRTTGSIDVSAADATLIFTNAAAITLPSGFFINAVNNLTINGAGGITSAGNFSINGILNLQSNNPSATKGLLDMWNGSTALTLNMGASSINDGIGDTTGIIKRVSISSGVSYSFGSQFTKVYFANVGTMPTELSVKVNIGVAPSWQTGAINREMEVIQTGAVGTSATVSYHYLDSELNGNDEQHLVLWVKIGNIEYGASASDVNDNWVSLSNVNIAFFSGTFDSTKNITLDEYSTNNTLTWNGSVSTSWTTVANWTPNIGPSITKNIIIPDALTTPFDPVLPLVTGIKSVTLQSGAILNAVAAAQTTIEGTSAWSNQGGTFNPNTSTIIFTNASATISGITDFYNLTINSGKLLSMTDGCTVRIAGAITNNGSFSAIVLGTTTVEYNGASQTVLNPNGSTAGYSNLILSGSGIKTMPAGLQTILGDFSLAGTASVTALSALTIGGNLTIGNGTTLNSGNFNHSLGGDFDNNGTFNAATGHSIIFNGSSPQSILGTAATTFDQLTISNGNGVLMYNAVNAANLLTLDSGTLSVGESTLGILGTISKNSGNLEVGSLSSLSFGGTGAITLAPDLFNTNPSLYNLTINRPGGVVLGQETAVGGVLNLLSGTLNIAALNLTINTVSVTAPGSATMIIADGGGEIRKILSQYVPFTYPVGDASGTAEYSPITITLNDDNSASHYFGVKLANSKYPDNASTSNYLTRYWNVSQSGGGQHLVTLNAAYTNADITGIESAISEAVLTGAFNQDNNPWVKYDVLSAGTITVNNTALISGQITTVTGITAASPTVSIVGITDACIGSTIPLSTVVTGDSGFIYNWTPAAFLSSTSTANPTVVNITTSTTYTVTVKDGNGIIASAAGTINVGATTTYNGTWSNGLPNSTASVIIAANYAPAASFECCSLTVNNNAVVSIPSGMNVTLNGILTVAAGSSFTLQNNANLIQNTNNANSGTITVIRNSAPIVRLDHTLWSSPVTGTQTLQQFSPTTLANRFYVYNILNNTYTSTPATGYFPLAKAIAVRAPNNWSTVQTVWPGSFTGVPNNGDIATPLEMTGAAYNGIGNPYPSAISGTELVNANSSRITGTLYFYAHTLAINATTGLFPPGTNYAVWNPGMGGTPSTVGGGGTGSSPVTPNGIIQTGQGFLVKAVAQGNMVFTNSMRKIDNANQFFKGTAVKTNSAEPDIERHRIWLSLTRGSTGLNTILVGYAAGATSGIDYGYDGLRFGVTGSELYSVIGADAYTIQGKALPFLIDDTVPLGFKAAESGSFTIAVYKTDGLFTGDQDILIKDNLTGTTSSIKTTPYTFTSEIGTFDTRFEMVYTKGTLGLDPQTAVEESVILYVKSNTLFVQSSQVITTVRIFDMLGRMLYENKKINDTHFQHDKSGLTGQVVLVQVTDSENHKVVKKIIF
ncbi:hypothetical protein EV142_103355 [Flavobacterium circumlabens]|uniref:T9SS C-terminal target domain-containing protein n=3 Tax=Flavobacterium circumlabens TaxID=2133765 RepID=A0ABY2B002_9FLAO|nr:hypothetical protein EV142_103355 [Flavobacterium circumlabens]